MNKLNRILNQLLGGSIENISISPQFDHYLVTIEQTYGNSATIKVPFDCVELFAESGR